MQQVYHRCSPHRHSSCNAYFHYSHQNHSMDICSSRPRRIRDLHLLYLCAVMVDHTCLHHMSYSHQNQTMYIYPSRPRCIRDHHLLCVCAVWVPDVNVASHIRRAVQSSQGFSLMKKMYAYPCLFHHVQSYRDVNVATRIHRTVQAFDLMKKKESIFSVDGSNGMRTSGCGCPRAGSGHLLRALRVSTTISISTSAP